MTFGKILKLLAILLLTGASFQPSRAVAKNSVDKARIIQVLMKEFQTVYVFPEVAKKMEEALKKNLEEGRYASIDDPAEFASKLQEDLIAVSHDKHINIRHFDKEPTDQGDTPAARAAALKEMQANNFGFFKVEILTGNIGYIELLSFDPAEVGGETAIAAMKFVAHTQGLIFDVRSNGGGDPSMIQLLLSYLVAEPTHLNSFYTRRTDSYEQFWTPAHVEGTRYLDKPVYVLTSGGSFSAAEEFSYDLKNLKRATLVGETTGGGAHPVNFVYLKDIKIGAMIPYGRAINPITKTNWEVTGVEPDVKVSRDDALKTAHSLALESALKKAKDPEEKRLITWSIETVKANIKPFPLPVEKMQTYVGSYGERKIALENNQLVYSRNTRRFKLIPMAEDTFAAEGLDYLRIQFNRDSKGGLVGLSNVYSDGRIDKSSKDKS